MKKFCGILTAVLTLLSLSGCMLLRTQCNASDWQLVWHDEFEKDGKPNPDNWDYERGFVRNQELQWYQPDNAVCRGGMLVIEARREHKRNPDYRQGSDDWRNREWIDYTSACLISKKKHEFTYGKFEMRARIDTRLGSWPAFWTLGASYGHHIPWPECGEVDIMEYYTDKVLANVFYSKAFRKEQMVVSRPLAELGGDAWSKEFHVWSMGWDERRIDLFIDGKPVLHFDVDQATDGGEYNAFRGPHYMLINQAIGANGGDPSKTEFPIHLEVDWVRVYRAKRN